MMTTLREKIEELQAAQATGCPGAGGYRAWAKKQGYPIVKALEMCSSAGDWSFLVSKDGEAWQLMWQENRWPRPGFDRYIEEEVWYGTLEAVIKQMYYGRC